MRIDKYLVEQGYFSSRQKAQDAIEKESVSVNNKIVSKSYIVQENDCIEVIENNDFVARSGNKLQEAITSFKIDLNNKVVIDIGASTGGFTECCLRNGASFVYAVDVGSNQLVDSLRNHKQVSSLEQTNARYLTKEQFDQKIDFICMDVSFISITLLLPVIYSLLEQGGEAVILLKPQFEVGKNHLNKHGVVKNDRIKEEVVQERILFCKQLSFQILGCIPSSLIGRKGNQEYLLYIKK